MMIIVRPGTAAFHPAVLLSFGTAVCAALYNLSTRRLAGVDTTTTQQFYASGVATLCIAPFSFGGWAWPRLVAKAKLFRTPRRNWRGAKGLGMKCFGVCAQTPVWAGRRG